MPRISSAYLCRFLLLSYLAVLGWLVVYAADYQNEAQRTYLSEQRELYLSHRVANPDTEYLSVPQFFENSKPTIFAVVAGAFQFACYSYPKDRFRNFIASIRVLNKKSFTQYVQIAFSCAFCTQFFSKQISLRAGPAVFQECA